MRREPFHLHLPHAKNLFHHLLLTTTTRKNPSKKISTKLFIENKLKDALKRQAKLIASIVRKSKNHEAEKEIINMDDMINPIQSNFKEK